VLPDDSRLVDNPLFYVGMGTLACTVAGVGLFWFYCSGAQQATAIHPVMQAMKDASSGLAPSKESVAGSDIASVQGLLDRESELHSQQQRAAQRRRDLARGRSPATTTTNIVVGHIF
jgi:hypothetical protein